MRVGWLQDDHGYIGGAEMTAAEFRAAAPDDVEIVDCPPGQIDYGCEVYIAHNAVLYDVAELEPLQRVVKYAHDMFPHDLRGSREWLRQNAEWIFCSPAQRERMGLEGVCVPPPIKTGRVGRAGRKGIVSVAQWRNPGKGPGMVAEYAREFGQVDVYGPGPFLPNGPGVNYCGEIPPDRVSDLLARYRTFVFLPVDFEPFCRTVAEAHFAGCEVVTNNLVGARYWLEQEPDALDTAADDFWGYALAAVADRDPISVLDSGRGK